MSADDTTAHPSSGAGGTGDAKKDAGLKIMRQIKAEFPDRPVFVIKGEVSFKRRAKIIADFEATADGILVCTRQSLKSSANIPTCNEVILESLLVRTQDNEGRFHVTWGRQRVAA